MTVLVIGGTGFLGRNIVENLLSKHIDLRVLTRHPDKLNIFSKKIPFIQGDLLDCSKLDLSPYRYLINCSGEIHNESLMRTLHVDSIGELLNKIKNNPNIHWLQISSVGVYGRRQQGIIHEDTPFSPIGEYELTKAEGESVVKNFCVEHNIPYTIIRPSNVFGTGMPNQSLAQLIKIIKRNLFFYVGKNISEITMNYVHVKDVANFVCNCLENEKAINQDFIISDQLSLPAFIKIISEHLGTKTSFPVIPERYVRLLAKFLGFIPSFPITDSRIDALTSQATYSTEKAKKYLGFNPFVGVENGLRDFCTTLFK